MKVSQMANSKTYNDVPETKGIARNKGTFTEPTELERQIAERLRAFQAQQKEGDDNV